MLKPRNDRPVYLALVLATAAAILSAAQPGNPFQQAQLLLLTVGPAATVIANTIEQNAETVVSP